MDSKKKSVSFCKNVGYKSINTSASSPTIFAKQSTAPETAPRATAPRLPTISEETAPAESASYILHFD